MDEQPQTKEPLTDTEYTAGLAFLVGYMYAALVRVRSSAQISSAQEHQLDEDLKIIRPTLERVYSESFQRPL